MVHLTQVLIYPTLPDIVKEFLTVCFNVFLLLAFLKHLSSEIILHYIKRRFIFSHEKSSCLKEDGYPFFLLCNFLKRSVKQATQPKGHCQPWCFLFWSLPEWIFGTENTIITWKKGIIFIHTVQKGASELGYALDPTGIQVLPTEYSESWLCLSELVMSPFD